MPNKPRKKTPIQRLGYEKDGVLSKEPPEWFLSRLGPAFDAVLGTESVRKGEDGDEPDNSAA